MRTLLCIYLLCVGPALAQYASTDLPIGRDGKETTLHYFIFSSKTHTLQVIDRRGAKPAETLEQAMLSHNCLAGCNGGFFDLSSFHPSGLIIANGTKSGTSGRKSSIVSATITADQGKLELIRSHVFEARNTPLPCNLLQAGPFLIENGQAHPTLSKKHLSPRSFIASNGADLWLIGSINSVTLPDLAKALAKPDTIPGFTIENAVNLDGGPSSGLWIQQPSKAPLYLQERQAVANYLGVVPISSKKCQHSELAERQAHFQHSEQSWFPTYWPTILIGGIVLVTAISMRSRFRKKRRSN